MKMRNGKSGRGGPQNQTKLESALMFKGQGGTDMRVKSACTDWGGGLDSKKVR